tara:strand:- start:361 stop:579 length:219 start_codon:yes stop_codon:yes gene_type:complete
MGGALATSIQLKVAVIIVCVIISAIACFHYYIRQHMYHLFRREINEVIPTTNGIIVTNIPNNAIIITIEAKT